jgi:putative transposase
MCDNFRGRRAQRMRKSRFSEEQIISLLKRVEMGQLLTDVCREYGISDATHYRWKAQHGGLEVNQLRRLRQLENENRKLKQVVADLTLDNRALKDIAAKKLAEYPWYSASIVLRCNKRRIRQQCSIRRLLHRKRRF